jgi:flagellar motility protein MotE (MotC chaperone)
MKNLLFLGVVALLLFSISAALSLWLNQSKQSAADAEKDKEKDKVIAKNGGEPKENPENKQPPKVAPPPKLDVNPAEQQEDRALRREQQKALVLKDVESQIDANETLLRQVSAELKNVTTKINEADATAAELLKKKTHVQPNDPKNMTKLAEIYEAMMPDNAATILKQMAESGTGKMDEAAQILALMKPRNSARIIEAMNDATLGAQLSASVLKMRGPSPAPAPSVPKTP